MQPSIPQMLNRLNGGHTYVLRVLAGRMEPRVGMSFAEMRGVKTARSTLVRWACIERDGLTERGQQLLASWERRETERKATVDAYEQRRACIAA